MEKLYKITSLKNKSKLSKIILATYTKKFKPYLKIKNQKYFLINSNENI